jgi:hypothetical protein
MGGGLFDGLVRFGEAIEMLSEGGDIVKLGRWSEGGQRGGGLLVIGDVGGGFFEEPGEGFECIGIIQRGGRFERGHGGDFTLLIQDEFFLLADLVEQFFERQDLLIDLIEFFFGFAHGFEFQGQGIERGEGIEQGGEDLQLIFRFSQLPAAIGGFALVELLHFEEFFRVGGGGKKRSGVGLFIDEEDGAFLLAEMNVEFFVFAGVGHFAQAQEGLQIIGEIAAAHARDFDAIEDVAGFFSAPPGNGMAIVGFNGDGAFFFAMADHEVAGVVAAEGLQRGDDGGFAAVVGAKDDGESRGGFDHRMGVGHVVGESDSDDHRRNKSVRGILQDLAGDARRIGVG